MGRLHANGSSPPSCEPVKESKKDCGQMVMSVLQYLLPAIGVCRNFPRSMVHTSEQYLGLGVKHPHNTQEILIKELTWECFTILP
jgi:hypothetical protein